MKKQITILFIFVLLVFQLFPQKEYKLEYQVSIQALDCLKSKDIKGFKELFEENILKGIDENIFSKYTNQAYEILEHYKYPEYEKTLTETSQVKYQSGNIKLISINFPFSHASNPGILSDYQIIFVFSKEIEEGKIIALKIRDLLAPGKKIVESAKTKPHLEKFDFNVKQIKWFRIWYSSGSTNRKVGNNHTYALSGNYEKLKQAKINRKLEDIFKIINDAKVERKEYKYELQKKIGTPEYLYLRFKFQNYPYKEYKEIQFFTILQGEKEVKEPNAGYMVITHSEVFKYYINMNDYPKLFEKLKELAYIDHGEYLTPIF